MPYPSTYPPSAADPDTVDLAGRRCPRLTSPSEVARRLAELDEAYIRAEFSVLDQLAADRPGGPHEARRQIASGWLPQPAYRLDDGTEMIPVDYFDPVDKAGGVGQLHSWFREEYIRAAGALNLPVDDATVAEQWNNYLSGGYGVCLRHASPAGIAEKAYHITRIEELVANPRPGEAAWCGNLRDAVEGLSNLERPGAILDPPRWGGPMSPQWYGSYLRSRFPQAFSVAD